MALAGFNETYYLTAKLAQLGEKFDEWQGKSTDFLKDYLANVGMTPEEHYEKYGWSEDLNPNAYFNGYEYVEAKAQQLFDAGKYGSLADAKAAFEAAWAGNPYDHYLQYGGKEGVNPSNAFDNSAYLDAKVAALKDAGETQKDGSEWTADALNEYFASLGLTPLTHFVEYGEDEELSAPEVPADKQVDPDPGPANPGENYTLTDGVDTSPDFDGTSGDDTYVGTDKTFTTGDDLDGKGGTDTLKVTFAAAATPVVDLTNIENVTLRNAGGALTLDASGWTGVEKLTSDRAAAAVTVNNLDALPNIGITKGGGFALTVNTTADLSGSEDAVTLVTDSADVGVLLIDDAAGKGVEVVTVENTGDSVIDNIKDGAATADISSLTVTGSGSLDLNDTAITYKDMTTVSSTGVGLILDIDNSASTAGTDTTITSTGADDDITVVAANGAAANAAVTTVSLGDGNNTLDLTNGTSLQEVAVTTGAGKDVITLDVSKATVNDSTASVVAGAGNDTLTVTANLKVALSVDMGAGDDTVTIDTINATANVTDSIDGGAGTDTLRGSSAKMNAIGADADQLATLANFEQLAISDALANDQDLTAFGFNKISLAVGTASAGTITMDSGDTIAFDEAAVVGAVVTSGTVTAAVDGASGAGSNDDVVNLEMAAEFDGLAAYTYTGILSVNHVETLNVTTSTETDEDDLFGGENFDAQINDGSRLNTITVDAALATTVSEGNATFLAIDTFDAGKSTAGVTVDLSNASQGVTMTGGEGNDDFTGSAFADIITTGDGDDEITGGKGADTMTGGEGADTFVIAANDSLEASMDDITDFTLADDILDLAVNTHTVDIPSGSGIDVKAAISGGTGTETVTAISTNGIITLEGADAGEIDTLAEWIDVLEIGLVVANDQNAAFEFGGNTYVFQDNTTATGGNDIVELTGVTGVTALDTAAADNTIVLA